MKSFVGVTIGVAVFAVALAACSNDNSQPGVGCGGFIVPGTVVLRPGVELTIRNAQGQAAASGDSAFVVRGSASNQGGQVRDSLTLDLYTGTGTFDILLRRPFYRDTTLRNVVVQAGDCGTVLTTSLAVTLQPVAGAPPVRSVAVFGADFLPNAGAQARLVAVVDADAGVSHAVTWRSNDTTLARIDQTGLVTAQCTTRGGTDSVTAKSVVDTTKRAT